MPDPHLQSLDKSQLIAKIEALQQQLASLAISETKYRILLDKSSDPIFMFNTDGQYLYVNQAFAEGVGKPIEAIINHKIWDVFPQDEADRRYAVVKWVFEHGETRVIEVRVPRPNGDRYYITTVKPVSNEQAEVILVICISKEITDRKHAESELYYLSNHDTLTGLYNRAFFESEISRLEASRMFPISIIVADMDNLKQMNDRYGHPAGDELLRCTAKILRQSFRNEDIIARTGGDEFIILLPQTDHSTAEEIISRLRMNISSQTDPPLRLSIGLATGYENDHLYTVMRTADDRMYQDKAVHKNRK